MEITCFFFYRSIMLAATVFLTIVIVHERWRVISSPNTLVKTFKKSDPNLKNFSNKVRDIVWYLMERKIEKM